MARSSDNVAHLLLAACLLSVQAILLCLALYILVLTLAGLLPTHAPDTVAAVSAQRRLAIVVPARDEEMVIRDLLESVALQTYPARLRDTFVVADNCTDRTAEVAAGFGVVVYERTAEDSAVPRRGKAEALQLFFEQIHTQDLHYDGYVVMDADSVMAPDFLEAINNCFDRGYEVVQGSRRAKNPDASWVSRLDDAAEAVATLEQRGRVRFGLSARLSGTAMAFSRAFFEAIGGWKPTCLDEVAELMALAALHSFKVCWCPLAVIVDERVSRAVQLSTQRQRWFVGIVEAFRRYFHVLLWSGLRERDLHKLEQGLELLRFQVPRNVLIAILTLLLALSAFHYRSWPILHWYVWAVLLCAHLLCFTLALLVHGASWRTHVALLLSPLFLLAYVRAFAGLLLREPTPIRTEHVTVDTPNTG